MRKFRIPVPPIPKREYNLIINLKEKQYKIVVKPEKIPYSKTGLPGSVLDIVSGSGEENIIEHSCGGVQACSTCHIFIEKGFDDCSESSEREEDYIEKAKGIQLNSRLACCCVPQGNEDIIVIVPEWNVNEVKESD